MFKFIEKKEKKQKKQQLFKTAANYKEKGHWMMLDSTRVQIKSRKESSAAILNLHKSYLFLKCDLVKKKLENWKRTRAQKNTGHTLRYTTAESWRQKSAEVLLVRPKTLL